MKSERAKEWMQLVDDNMLEPPVMRYEFDKIYHDINVILRSVELAEQDARDRAIEAHCKMCKSFYVDCNGEENNCQLKQQFIFYYDK